VLRVLVEFVPNFEGGEQRELACAEIRGARIEGMTADYSLVVREGSNPLANTLAWAAAGDIINHDRAQTVWALVNKVSMFGWLAATRNGSLAQDLRIAAGPAAYPESVAARIRQIAEAGGRVALRAEELTNDEIAEITTDLRGCAWCDGIIGPQWKFCAFCGEQVPE
jgi:hypothetical protein